MARIMRENPGSPMKEVMQIVGQEWRAHKAGRTPLRTIGERAASGGWSDSDSQPNKQLLASMMDSLKVSMETISWRFVWSWAHKSQ